MDAKAIVVWVLAAVSAGLLGLSLTGDGSGPSVGWSYVYLLALGLVVAWFAWETGQEGWP